MLLSSFLQHPLVALYVSIGGKDRLLNTKNPNIYNIYKTTTPTGIHIPNVVQVNGKQYIHPTSMTVMRGSIAELLVAIVVPTRDLSSLAYGFFIVTNDVASEGRIMMDSLILM